MEEKSEVDSPFQIVGKVECIMNLSSQNKVVFHNICTYMGSKDVSRIKRIWMIQTIYDVERDM